MASFGIVTAAHPRRHFKEERVHGRDHRLIGKIIAKFNWLLVNGRFTDLLGRIIQLGWKELARPFD